jgi:hypothetical protein
MEALFDELTLKSGVNIPQKQWDPKHRKQRPLVKQLIRNLYPKLTPPQVDSFTEFAGPYISKKFQDALPVDITQTQLLNVVRDWTALPKTKATFDSYKNAYQRNIGVPLEETDKGVPSLEITTNRPAFDAGKMILRSRYTLPGTDDFSESTEQAMSDIVQADLFSYQTSNMQDGTNNTVYLDSEINLKMNMMGANMPRPPAQLEQLVGITKILYQYNDTQDVEAAIGDIVVESMVQTAFANLPPVSVTLHDDMDIPDPFGLPKRNNYLVPVQDLSLQLQRDYTQGTEFRELDSIGFKRDGFDTWRFPREASQFLGADTVQPMAYEQEMSLIEGQGVNPTYSFSIPPAPMYETTYLRGGNLLPRPLFA